MAGKFNFTPGYLRPGIRTARNPAIRKVIETTRDAKEKNVPSEITDEMDNAIRIEECRELYVDKHCSAESDTLREIRLFTEEMDWKKAKEEGKVEGRKGAGMMTGKVEGEFLKFMVSMQKAKRVLDIGMFTGYSALAMAEALPADGVVITCDFEEYLQEINRKKFDESPHGAKIDIRIGDAKETLRSLAEEGQKFDFIFADADKENNQNYYNIIMDKGLLAPNGTIVFDNAFRGGQAFLMDDDPMDRLNTLVEKDPRVRRVLIPLRDGMLLVRRAGDVLA